MAIVDSARSRPPVAWPSLSLHGHETVANWMGDPLFSDYASLSWWGLDGPRFSYKNTFPHILTTINKFLRDGKLPFIQHQRPTLAYVSTSGPLYQKLGPGSGSFDPGKDDLNKIGVTSHLVSAQISAMVALGLSGVKSYQFDHMAENRANDENNHSWQTGASPFTGQTDLWQAQAAAFNLINDIERYIIAHHISSPSLGDDIVTGVKKGNEHFLLIAVSFSEVQRNVTLDLAPYYFPNGTDIIRYRLLGKDYDVSTVMNRDFDRVKMMPGESFWWLFRPSIAVEEIPTIHFRTPVPNIVVANSKVLPIEVEGRNIDRVEFFLDGRLLAIVGSPPFSTKFNTNLTRLGIWHSFSATAFNSINVTNRARTAIFVACDDNDAQNTSRECPSGLVPFGMSCISKSSYNDSLAMIPTTIEVDPGSYRGMWSLGRTMGCCYNTYQRFGDFTMSGPRNVSIEIKNDSGKQWSELFGISIVPRGRFFFSMRSDKSIDEISNPYVATISPSGKKITFNTTPIKITTAPSSYKGWWALGGESGIRYGQETIDLIPYMTYRILFGYLNRFHFDVDSDGSILQVFRYRESNSNFASRTDVGLSNIASISGSVITFKTMIMKVDLSSYGGHWSIDSIPNSATPSRSAAGTASVYVTLIHGLFYHFTIGLGPSFDIEINSEDGRIVLLDPLLYVAAVDNSGTTRTLKFDMNPVTIHVDPGDFEGQWSIPTLMTATTSTQVTLQMLTGLTYFVRHSGSGFYFDLDSTGSVSIIYKEKTKQVATNSSEIAIFDKSTNTLIFNTNVLFIDAGAFPGSYIVRSVSPYPNINPLNTPVYAVPLIPSMQYEVTIHNDGFSFILDPDGYVSSIVKEVAGQNVWQSASEIASFESSPGNRTMTFNTNPFEVSPSISCGIYQIIGYPQSNGVETFHLIPSLEYTFKLLVNNVWWWIRFNLDSAGHFNSEKGRSNVQGPTTYTFSGASMSLSC